MSNSFILIFKIDPKKFKFFYLVVEKLLNVPDALPYLGSVGRVRVLVGRGLGPRVIGPLAHHLGLELLGPLLNRLHPLPRLYKVRG